MSASRVVDSCIKAVNEAVNEADEKIRPFFLSQICQILMNHLAGMKHSRKEIVHLTDWATFLERRQSRLDASDLKMLDRVVDGYVSGTPEEEREIEVWLSEVRRKLA